MGKSPMDFVGLITPKEMWPNIFFDPLSRLEKVELF